MTHKTASLAQGAGGRALCSPQFLLSGSKPAEAAELGVPGSQQIERPTLPGLAETEQLRDPQSSFLQLKTPGYEAQPTSLGEVWKARGQGGPFGDLCD